MNKCQSGRVIKKTIKGKEYFFIRLNLVDDEKEGKSRYSTKDIRTNIPVSIRNKSKANALLEEYISEYSGDVDRMPVEKYISQWLENKKPAIEETTYQNYRYRVKIIADYFLDHPIILAKLKPEDIRDFYYYMLTTEYTVGRGEKRSYSNTTIKDVSVVLRMSLEDAVIWGYINASPAAKIKAPKRTQDIRRKAYIAADEVDVFLSAISGHRLEVVFILALYYGLRREEILGIKWKAIRDNKLHIEHTVTITDRLISKDRTKTAESCRQYPILPVISEKLDIIRENQKKNRSMMGDQYEESDYVFTWEDGRLYSPDYVTKSFKKLVRRDDRLDNALTLHSLRASCVSILVHSGMDIKDVQMWVGHKDIQTTLNVYAMTNARQQLKVANAMADVMFKAGNGNS